MNMIFHVTKEIFIQPLYCEGWVLESTSCTLGYGSNDSVDDTGSTSTGSTISTGGSQQPLPEDTPILTIPFVDNLSIRINNFLSSLDPAENTYLDANPDIKAEILNFLESQVTDFSLSEYPNDITDFILDLLNLAIQQNSTFTFNSSIDPNSTLSFNSVSDFEQYLNSIVSQNQNPESEETQLPTQDQNTKMSTFKYKINYFGGAEVNIKYNVDVNGNMTSINNVTSSQYGLWTSGSMQQTSYSSNLLTNGNINVEVQIEVTYDYTIFGFGVTYTNSYTIGVNLNPDGTRAGSYLIANF